MLNLLELAVDTIQASKRQFVENYVTDPDMKNMWNNYIDSQTEFLHVAIRTGNTVAVTLGRQLVNSKIPSCFPKYWDTWTTQSNKKS